VAIPTITVRPPQALEAYRAVDSGEQGGVGGDFSGALARAVEGVVSVNRDAEVKSQAAIAGEGNITEVVTAVAKAQLALQTTATVRDRVVQAYQQIMSMPI
jgi:flagellar hook-basal body complex protein FliE